ncbi:hypothetical protein AAMO2058_000428800 [Amorphochlora amoebiformis]
MSRYRVKYPEYRGILCFRDLKIGLVNSTKTRTMIYAVSDPYYQSFLNNGKGKKNSNQSCSASSICVNKVSCLPLSMSSFIKMQNCSSYGNAQWSYASWSSWS